MLKSATLVCSSRPLLGAFLLVAASGCQLVGYGTRSLEAGSVGVDSGGMPPLGDGGMDADSPLPTPDAGPGEGGPTDADAGALPDASGIDAALQGDASRDGAVDAHASDATVGADAEVTDASADADVVPPPTPPFCEDGRCQKTCVAGESCNVTCSDALRCDLECEAGATCFFGCRNSAECNLRCRPGSACTVTCQGSNCSAVDCDEGASCKLYCDNNTCDFESCEDAIHKHCTLGGLIYCGQNLSCPLVL